MLLPYVEVVFLIMILKIVVVLIPVHVLHSLSRFTLRYYNVRASYLLVLRILKYCIVTVVHSFNVSIVLEYHCFNIPYLVFPIIGHLIVDNLLMIMI